MRIKEVAKMFGMTEDTLRYYEKSGLIGPIKKMPNGMRDYTEDDLARIEFVKCMRGATLPIEVLRKYMELYDQGDSTFDKRKELLIKQRDILKDKITDMNKAYEKLNMKIEMYNNRKHKKKGENHK